MSEIKTTILNKLGLHARSASKLVSISSRFSSEITIFYANKTANGKSIMELLMLAAKQGEDILIHCQGDDEDEALQALINLINNRFDEDE
jgi:phosphocarrier protein